MLEIIILYVRTKYQILPLSKQKVTLEILKQISAQGNIPSCPLTIQVNWFCLRGN